MYKFSAEIRRTTSESDGSIVLNLREGLIFKLNPLGQLVCDMIEQGLREPAIVESICRRFPDEPEQRVALDVHDFLLELNEKQIVQWCATVQKSEVGA